MIFVGITKKIKIQSVRSLLGSFDNINPILPFVTFYIVQAPNSTYLFRHDAMKMAAARPQSVFTADVYLSHNTSHAPALAFVQNVRVAGWTTVGDGAGRKNGSGTYVIYDCMITRSALMFVLLASDLTGWANRERCIILKRYSKFEDLHDTLKRNLPVSR